MKTVLITGIAGFLGGYAARHFAKRGWKVAGIDGRLPENADLPADIFRQVLPSPEFKTLLREIKPEVCIHCAGSASVNLSMENPAADFRANTLLTFDLLDELRQNAPGCRLLLLSSAAVYGDPATLPVKETHAVSPLSPYGFHKRQAEMICEEFSSIHGLSTTSVRIFSAYGQGLRRQVIWDICEKALRTSRLVLRGTGTESRDFIHGEDIARALHLLADNAPGRGEVYNLASGCETSICELATRILETLQLPIELEFDGHPPPGNPKNWQADISQIQKLGFVPSISFEEGIRAASSWSAAELIK